MSDFYIGIDGGGTKTACVLLDEGGGVLAQTQAGPSNPTRVGFEQCFQALSLAIDTVVSQAELAPEQIRGLCAGLAGAGRIRVMRRVMIYLVQKLPRTDIHVTTDMEIALEAAVGAGCRPPSRAPSS